MDGSLHKIKLHRHLKGYSQSYIAYKLGISQYAYWKVESGETDITLSRLRKIAEILEVDIREIL